MLCGRVFPLIIDFVEFSHYSQIVRQHINIKATLFFFVGKHNFKLIDTYYTKCIGTYYNHIHNNAYFKSSTFVCCILHVCCAGIYVGIAGVPGVMMSHVNESYAQSQVGNSAIVIFCNVCIRILLYSNNAHCDLKSGGMGVGNIELTCE